MKLVIASDIHGSAYWCRKLLDRIELEQPDFVVLLGDLLYHGPRNTLPRDYAPAEVAAMLNGFADRIVAVRGNCDSEVDQMMLDFPCLADYSLLFEDAAEGFAHEAGACEGFADGAASHGRKGSGDVSTSRDSNSSEARATSSARGRSFFLTHGHLWSPDTLPACAFGSTASVADGSIRRAVLSGHTHVKTCELRDGVLLVNPGSVSIPKDGSNSFMVYEGGIFRAQCLPVA